jgi:hypothetical protein
LVQIEKVDIEPFESFADPHILFRVLLDVGSPHILIYPSLRVYVGDGQGSWSGLGICFLGHDRRPSFKDTSESQLDFLLALTSNVIRKIEEARIKEGKGNVQLQLIFSGSALRAKLTMRKDPSRPGGEVVTFESSVSPIEQLNAQPLTRISSSDWVNEYQRRLGLGKSLLVEIPLDMDDVTAGLKDVQDKELAARVVDAASALDHANRFLREGRWRDSVRQTRDALEILRKGRLEKEGVSMTQGVKELVEETGLPAEAGDDLKQVIDRLYSFASATHPISKKGETVDIAVFEKEDAVFMLTCVESIISMIAKKLRRVG